MRFTRFLHALHNWLGLALAVQVILWMASGVVMSLLAIEHVRGETAASIDAPPELRAQHYFPPAGVIAEVDGAQEVALKTWLGRAVYVVSGADGDAMFDADTGERLTPLSEKDARRVAVADFAGEGEIETIAMLTDPPQEFGRPGPVWRADFNDEDETRLYISPTNGEVLARRNRVWRFYDFFWMLHIMDYKERHDFNNPLVQTFSASALIFALSGLGLVILRLLNGRYVEDVRRLRPPRGKTKSASKVADPELIERD